MPDSTPLRRLFSRNREYRLHWLTSDLALSRQPAPADWQLLQREGLAAAFDLRAEASSADEASSVGIDYLRLPVIEGEAPALNALLAFTSVIACRIGRGDRVVVFCREGRGRSALVACLTLVRLGLPLDGAYRILKQARPEAQLNDAQLARLEEAAAAIRPRRLSA